MKTYEFDAVVQKHEGIDGAYIIFPYDVQKEFGVKGQVKVKAFFDRIEYRGSLVKMGMNCHWLGITKEIRKKINKSPGDNVHVILQKDDEVRTVEIPDGFVRLLKEEGLLEVFEKMSYTHRKEYIVWISDAKKDETRRRRMEKAIEVIRKKVK